MKISDEDQPVRPRITSRSKSRENRASPEREVEADEIRGRRNRLPICSAASNDDQEPPQLSIALLEARVPELGLAIVESRVALDATLPGWKLKHGVERPTVVGARNAHDRAFEIHPQRRSDLPLEITDQLNLWSIAQRIVSRIHEDACAESNGIGVCGEHARSDSRTDRALRPQHRRGRDADRVAHVLERQP